MSDHSREQEGKELDDRFVELCRTAYRAIYSQQKHLDPCNEGQMGNSRTAKKALEDAFALVGASL